MADAKDAKIDMKVGVLFQLKKGTDRRSFLYGLEAGLALARRLSFVDEFLGINNHDKGDYAGRFALKYPKVEDVPLVDVPCPCGSKACFGIVWKESEA